MSMQGVLRRLGMEDSFEVDLITWLRENRKMDVWHIQCKHENVGIRGEHQSDHDSEEIQNY